MIIRSNYIVKLWSKLIGIKLNTGFVLPPFCFIYPYSRKEGINHEIVHLFQGNETFIIGFYIIYIVQYIYFRLKGLNHYKSYRSICFEKEAYSNQNDLDYLYKRKIWNWLKK